MDQISPPMRIVLAVAVVFLAAYMLVLKPKDETASAPAATPATPATASASDGNTASTSLGKAVEGARGAAAATEDEQNAQAAAGDETTNTPSTSSSTPSKTSKPGAKTGKPADPALAKLPKWLQNSIDEKVVAILFTNDKASDDRRTRAALKHAFTAHGKIVKRAVPISRIARYRPVAQGVDVQQSPTLLVIDRDRQAQALVGYSSLDAINQAVIDGLLATDVPVRKVEYLQKVRSECRQINHARTVGPSSGDTFAGEKKNLDNLITVTASSLGTLRNAAAPKRYKALKHTVNTYMASQASALRAVRTEAVGRKSIDAVKQNAIMRRNDKLENRTGLELAAVGISACT